MISLRLLLTMAAGVLVCDCRPARQLPAATTGAEFPISTGASKTPSLWLVARPGDCVGCSLEGVFIALRAAQSANYDGVATTAVLLAQSATDTLALAGALRGERVAANIVHLHADSAGSFFREDQLPALFVVVDSRIVRMWTAVGRRIKISPL